MQQETKNDTLQGFINYYSCPRSMDFNKELSYKAKLVYHNFLAHLNSKTELCFPSLYTQSKEIGIGKEAIKIGRKELIDSGWVKKEQRRDEGGHFIAWNWIIFDNTAKSTDSPPDRPSVRPSVGGAATNKRKYNNKKLNNYSALAKPRSEVDLGSIFSEDPSSSPTSDLSSSPTSDPPSLRVNPQVAKVSSHPLPATFISEKKKAPKSSKLVTPAIDVPIDFLETASKFFDKYRHTDDLTHRIAAFYMLDRGVMSADYAYKTKNTFNEALKLNLRAAKAIKDYIVGIIGVERGILVVSNIITFLITTLDSAPGKWEITRNKPWTLWTVRDFLLSGKWRHDSRFDVAEESYSQPILTDEETCDTVQNESLGLESFFN